MTWRYGDACRNAVGAIRSNFVAQPCELLHLARRPELADLSCPKVTPPPVCGAPPGVTDVLRHAPPAQGARSYERVAPATGRYDCVEVIRIGCSGDQDV